MSPPDLAWTAAIAAEHMTPGAAQAAWLEVATAAAGRLDEDALAGMMIASRQAASRANAAELTAAAQITARAADADPRIGLEADGRPVRLCRDAQGQIGLALMLTDYSAAAWADLGMTLAWRLPSTGRALAAGRHRPGPGEGDRRGHLRAERRRLPGRWKPRSCPRRGG